MNDREIVLDALSLVKHISDSEWIRYNCPFCLSRTGKPDKRESMGYNRESGISHCFKCKKKVKLNTQEVDKILGTRHGSVPDIYKATEEEAAEPPEDFTPIWCEPAASSMFYQPAISFLKSRGIPQHVWRDAGIGACITGRHKGRVIIPIFNEDDTKWCGWVGRTWYHTTKLRYLYSKGFRREKHLLNHSAILVPTEEPVILVEGSLDALPYWPNGVAVLGKPAHNHLNLLKKSKRPIAVCLDGDAWQEGWGFSQQLRLNGIRAGHVKLPPTEDPNSVDRDWLISEARKCVSY